MTTKTDDIKLPELPVAVPWHKGYDRESLESYARAAVEADRQARVNNSTLEGLQPADRQGRMPSDDELRAKWRNAGGSFYGPNVETGAMPEAQLLPFLRDLLSGQPAANSGPVKWEDAQRIADLPEVDELLSGFADDPTGDNGTMIVLAVMQAVGQPAASAEYRQLREFYDAQTDGELIDAQQHHIEKLQAKLHAASPIAASRVREG